MFRQENGALERLVLRLTTAVCRIKLMTARPEVRLSTYKLVYHERRRTQRQVIWRFYSRYISICGL